MLNKYYKYINPNFIFNMLFVVNFILLIIFFLGDFITVYYNKPTNQFVYDDSLRIFMEALILRIFGFTNLILLILWVISFKDKLYSYRVSKLIVFFIFLFIIATLLMESTLRPMFFFGIVCTIIIYDFAVKINEYYDASEIWFTKICYVLIAYTIVPILIFLINYIINNSYYFNFDYFLQLYTYDSFRGFTLDRIQFSYLTGLLILMIYIQNKIRLKYIILFILLVGLLLAQSRASIVALFISLIFYHISSIKTILIITIALFLFGITWLIFGTRVDLIGDPGGRIEIIYSAIETIFSSNFITVLFGSGNLYTLAVNGVQPHNSILQSVLDFGIILTFLWSFILIRFFNVINYEAKTFFIYLVVFGMFQTGFSAFVFLPITLTGYLIVLYFNNRGRNDNTIT